MLGSMSISARIYSGFAIVLTLLAGLVALTYTGTEQSRASFEHYRGEAERALLAEELSKHFLEASIAVKSYMNNGASENVASFDSIMRDASILEKKMDDIFTDPEEIRILKSLSGDQKNYIAAFKAIVEVDARYAEALAPMVPLAVTAGDDIGKLTAKALADADFPALKAATDAERAFLLARNHTTKFVDRKDPAEFDKALAQLDASLAALNSWALAERGGEARATAASASTAVADYRARLEALGELTEQRADLLRNQLTVIGPRVRQAYIDLSDKITDTMDGLGDATQGELAQVAGLSVGLGAAALAVGALLAFLIGRWIAQAVAGMAGAMTRMAGGDLEMTVEGDQHRHELGAMARALKTFQQAGIEKRRLDAEAEAARARDAEAANERAALQSAVAEVVDAAAQGDFGRRVDPRYKDDGLNGFAGQLNSLMDTVREGVGETARVMAALARGDLGARMSGSYRGAFAELQDNVNATVERLRDTVSEIQSVSDAMRERTSAIAEGAETLSGRAENQAASLEEIAATMEEMSATVRTNAENALSARDLSADAHTRADRGGAIVAKAVTAMGEISTGSAKIADIVSVIDGFAFQTNLLALNAAVEAARAGEAGKGFAVVASEVRMLAQRSAEAARDIKSLIEESADQVEGGVKLVEETGKALTEIVEAIGKVSDTITEISEASREQSSGVEEITSAITSMDEITQQNSAMADQSASAARSLADQAQALERLMAFFSNAGRRDGGATRDRSAAIAAE